MPASGKLHAVAGLGQAPKHMRGLISEYYTLLELFLVYRIEIHT